MSFSQSPKYSVAVGFVLAGLLASGCKPKASAPPAAAGPAEVAVVTMQPERVTLTTELPGRTTAYLVAEIRPQVSGLIQSRQFQEGSNVKAGDLLYQIDPAPYEAALNRFSRDFGANEMKRHVGHLGGRNVTEGPRGVRFLAMAVA